MATDNKSGGATTGYGVTIGLIVLVVVLLVLLFSGTQCSLQNPFVFSDADKQSAPSARTNAYATPLNRPYVPPPTFTENGIRYTGRACQRDDGSIGREGYDGQTIGCWRF
jgi:predicted small lipoprotein YifL